MKIQDKMRQDWDRRASVDARYWVAATQEADVESYERSAQNDTEAFLAGLAPHLAPRAEGAAYAGSLLDLGCGIGRMTALLAPHFGEVVGVDVSEVMIREARALHAGVGEGLRFEVNSGADLGAFADQSFQVVCSYSVLAHLPPDVVEAYFCEVGRALAEGGVFRYQFWVTPDPQAAAHPTDDNTLNIHVYDEAHLARLHARAGLTEVAREEIDYLDPLLNLRPVWITARRDTPPAAASPVEREVGEGLSEEELRMEYELMLYLSAKHMERGELEQAEPILERATHLAPRLPDAYLQWVELRLALDDLRGVRLLLVELLKHAPEHLEARLFLAQVLVASEEFSEALEALTPLATTAPLAASLSDDQRDTCARLRREAEVGKRERVRENARAQRERAQEGRRARAQRRR